MGESSPTPIVALVSCSRERRENRPVMRFLTLVCVFATLVAVAQCGNTMAPVTSLPGFVSFPPATVLYLLHHVPMPRHPSYSTLS
jgi:hypothetical protein